MPGQPDHEADAGPVHAFETLDELSHLEPDWRRLAEGRGNAFLTPEWFRCWFEHYGEEVAPFVPTLHDADGRLAGLLPLALPRSGRPRICRIAGANLGDHFYPLAVPGREAEVAAAVGEALVHSPCPWSILALDHVDLDGDWLSSIGAGAGIRLAVRRREAGPLPFIQLSRHGAWDDYLASRSKNLRQQVRNLSRRAEKKHSMRLRHTEDAGQVSADMDTFFRLHDLRFSEREGGSSLQSDRARAFHAEFAAAAFERGWLRLWFLELEETPAAVWYGWRLGERYAFFNSGFDPEWSRLSPGVLLQAAVVEAAFSEGATEFDLLLGDEPYKQRFAEASRTVSDVTLARALPHPASLVASTESAARRLGRRLPARLRRALVTRSLLRGRRR